MMLTSFALAALAMQQGGLTLAGTAGDGAVLQRGAPIEIAGTAEPRARVTVTLDEETVRARADRDGRWSATLPALAAGGPYELTAASGDQTVRASDVMIGDVLLCSGQSNMEYPVARALNPDTEIARRYPDIRLFTVPKAAAASPRDAFGEAVSWEAAEGEALAEFSAVCLFAARELQPEAGVTMGLVDASWGGSRIEAWLPQNLLEENGAYDEGLGIVRTYADDPAAGARAFGEVWEDWYVDAAGERPWADTGLLDGWQEAPAELGDWNGWGRPDLEGYRGILWYRATVDLGAEAADGAATLMLGIADDADTAWINGEFVGHGRSWSDARAYEVPGGVLREGENEIVVAVENGWGGGGLLAPTDETGLRIDGELISPEAWSVAKQGGDIGYPPVAPWTATSGLGSLYNGMIAPLGSPGFAGAIWYQGESNAGEADAYADLLDALVGSWRDDFGAKMPAAVVQLTGFGSLGPSGPGASGWAELRDAQRRVAAEDPMTGLVVTTDVGDRYDIHPANKQAVGIRAAETLTALMAGENADGGSPEGTATQSGRIVVRLPDAVSASPAGTPFVFPVETCGADGTCRPATAEIEDGDLLVEAAGDKAGDVASVRYCWADMPVCNLFADGGAPITPFEVTVER